MENYLTLIKLLIASVIICGLICFIQLKCPFGQVARPICEQGRQGSGTSTILWGTRYGSKPKSVTVEPNMAATGTARAAAMCITPVSFVIIASQRSRAKAVSSMAVAPDRSSIGADVERAIWAQSSESFGPPSKMKLQPCNECNSLIASMNVSVGSRFVK